MGKSIHNVFLRFLGWMGLTALGDKIKHSYKKGVVLQYYLYLLKKLEEK